MIVETALLTVGITCYREGEWLRECWESVLAQSDNRWTAILVMDGGADDKTRSIFEELSHPKLHKLALAENCGPYEARNKAVESTATKYHMYLDGDDKLSPNAVALVLDAFAKNPKVQCVWGDIETFGGSSGIMDKRLDLTGEHDMTKHIPGCCSYTKAMWEKVGGYAQELARGNADWDFSISILEANAPALHLPEVLYFYRRHEGSVSTSYTRKVHETFLIMLKRHPQYFSVGERESRFLAHGYALSAIGNYLAGDLKVAADYARTAQQYGARTDARLWWYRLAPCLPGILRRALDAFIRRAIGIFRSLGRDDT